MVLEQRSVTVFWIRLFLIIMVFGLAVGYIGTRFIKISPNAMLAQQRDDVAYIVATIDQIQKKQSLLEVELTKMSQQIDTSNKRLSVILDGLEELLHQKDVETGVIVQQPLPSNKKSTNKPITQNGNKQ